MVLELSYESKIFHEIEKSIEFLKEIGAIRNDIVCNKCGQTIRLTSIKKRGDFIYHYKCSKKDCRHSRNLLSFSIFSNTKLKLPTLLFTIYCIMGNASNYFFLSLVQTSENTFIRIKNSLLEIYKMLLETERKIGGDKIVLEVDETVISRSGIIKCPSAIDDEMPGFCGYLEL